MGDGFWKAFRRLRRGARKVGFPLWIIAIAGSYWFGTQTGDWRVLFIVCWVPACEVLFYL